MHRLKLLILCLVSTEDHFQLVIKVIMQIFPIANQHTLAMLCIGREDIWKKRIPPKHKGTSAADFSLIQRPWRLLCTKNRQPQIYKDYSIREMRILGNDRKWDI